MAKPSIRRVFFVLIDNNEMTYDHKRAAHPSVHESHDLHPRNHPLPTLPTALRTPQAEWNHKVPLELIK